MLISIPSRMEKPAKRAKSAAAKDFYVDFFRRYAQWGALDEKALRELFRVYANAIPGGGSESCVVCGRMIPEGRQVCPGCEEGAK